MNRSIRSGWLLGLAVAFTVGGLPLQIQSAEISPARRLPAKTLAVVAIPDAKALAERFQESSIGQMARDPQLKPLVDEVYGSLVKLLAPAEAEAGVSFGDVLAMFHGELVLAAVPNKDDQVQLVGWLDAGEQGSVVQKLLDRGEKTLNDEGYTRRDEERGSTKLVIFEKPGRSRPLIYANHGGTFLIGTHIDSVGKLVEEWDQPAEESLSSQPNYAAIQKKCRTHDDTAQILWYVDPIAVANIVGRQSAGGSIALALLPTLGLDGIQGLGGTIGLASEQFDSELHVHLLLDTPRAGVVELIAFTPGDTTPEPWVPVDAASYATLHWDVGLTYEKLNSLVDSFLGPGGLKNRMARDLEPIGLDLEADVLPHLGGRMSLMSWHEPPASLQSAATVVGIQLKDVAKFKPVFDKMREKFADKLTEGTFAGTTYYMAPEAPAPRDENRERLRMRATFCLLGDYLLIADRPGILHQALTAAAGQPGLATSLEFKLISNKLQRQAGEQRLAMLTFRRPEADLKLWYDIAQSERSRERLRGMKNEAAQAVSQALDAHPLPPFAILQQYFAPSGGMVLDDETGLHYAAFTLRRKKL